VPARTRRSCTNTQNRCAIAEGDLVLVDAGCEYDHYTADITRTWPASGQFSPPQRKVYAAVLATQKSAIAMARPGVTIDDIHHHCVKQLTAAMIELGLLTARSTSASPTWRSQYFMHGTSHWLGSTSTTSVPTRSTASRARSSPAW